VTSKLDLQTRALAPTVRMALTADMLLGKCVAHELSEAEWRTVRLLTSLQGLVLPSTCGRFKSAGPTAL
jgi:hypothetical protein